MLFYTHLVFSILISLIISDYFPYNKTIFILLIALFSLFLDIDEAKSKIGKKMKIISIPVNFIFGHRDFIHSLRASGK